jgi:hypothetical protein
MPETLNLRCVKPKKRINLNSTATNNASNIYTHVRPYISDKGAMKSGPNANEMRKIDSVIARIVGFVMPGRMIGNDES